MFCNCFGELTLNTHLPVAELNLQGHVIYYAFLVTIILDAGHQFSFQPTQAGNSKLARGNSTCK